MIVESNLALSLKVQAFPNVVIYFQLGFLLPDFPSILQGLFKKYHRLLVLKVFHAYATQVSKSFELHAPRTSASGGYHNLSVEKERALELFGFKTDFACHHDDQDQELSLVQVNRDVHSFVDI